MATPFRAQVLRQKAAMAPVANGDLNAMAVGTAFKRLMPSVDQRKHRSQAWPVCSDSVTCDLGSKWKPSHCGGVGNTTGVVLFIFTWKER